MDNNNIIEEKPIITNAKIEKLKQLMLNKELAKEESIKKMAIKKRKTKINKRDRAKRKKIRREKKLEKQKLETIERNKAKYQKIKAARPKKEHFSWRIIVTSQNKKLTEVCYASSMEEALFKYNKILDENKKDVRFPIKVSSRDHIQVLAKYELLLMKRNKECIDNETMFKNEMGKFSPTKPNTEKWLIFQKDDFLFEETFWVYGFNPKVQRKTFNYILNEILLNGVTNQKYPLKRVMVFKNKLIIENDDDFDIVICKNGEDCIRLYNELEKECLALKLKCIFFSGFTGDALKNRLVDKIMEKTGWDRQKTCRLSTRP